MTDTTPSDAFGQSAHVAYLHSIVWQSETEPLIAKLLAILGVSDPSAAQALARIAMRRRAYLGLTLWMKRLEDCPKHDRLGEEALKF